VRIAINSSFLSPLDELFGDVSIGRKVAGNTVLRADPGTRICIGNATNLQDNIRLALQKSSSSYLAVCGTK